MKHSIHYQVEYKLVSGGGILRGEIGAMTCIRIFDEYQPDEAIRFVNQYQCYKCKNIYNFPCEIRSKDEVKEGNVYHLQSPKIWHMSLRGDWRSFQQQEKRTGKKPKWSEWKHHEGDSYVVKAEFFNVKEREMQYSSGEYQTLEEAFKHIKFKDSKTRLLSDWTLYSKHQYIIP